MLCCHLEDANGAMGCSDGGSVWLEISNKNAESFVGYTQFFSNETGASITRTALVAHLVQSQLLNVPDRRRQWLIGAKRMPVEFPPICHTQKELEQEGGLEK